jgi:hypothetical protein
MKTNKTFAYGFLTVIIALAFIACPDEKTPESNPPVANAQAEPTHTLADNLTITLDGTDSIGNISAYAWECETYTADQGTVSAEYTKAQVNALITNAGTATATVKPRKAGTYVFKLTVTGNDSESDTDNVTVVVEPAGTVQKDVVVSFSAFTSGSTTLSFAPIYTPAIAGNGFVNSDVTYTVYCTELDRTYSGTELTANIDHGYTDLDMYTFTQTFKNSKGTVIKSQAIKVDIAYGFSALFDSNSTSISSIPSISLHLEKTITEFP